MRPGRGARLKGVGTVFDDMTARPEPLLQRVTKYSLVAFLVTVLLFLVYLALVAA
jgi:hypothetical protein